MDNYEKSIRIRAWLTAIAQGQPSMDIPEEAKIALHEFDRLEKENARFRTACEDVPTMLDRYCYHVRQDATSGESEIIRQYADRMVVKIDDKARAIRAALKEPST